MSGRASAPGATSTSTPPSSAQASASVSPDGYSLSPIWMSSCTASSAAPREDTSVSHLLSVKPSGVASMLPDLSITNSTFATTGSALTSSPPHAPPSPPSPLFEPPVEPRSAPRSDPPPLLPLSVSVPSASPPLSPQPVVAETPAHRTTSATAPRLRAPRRFIFDKLISSASRKAADSTIAGDIVAAVAAVRAVLSVEGAGAAAAAARIAASARAAAGAGAAAAPVRWVRRPADAGGVPRLEHAADASATITVVRAGSRHRDASAVTGRIVADEVTLLVLHTGQVVAAVGARPARLAGADAAISEGVAARDQEVVDTAEVHLGPGRLATRRALGRGDVLAAGRLLQDIVPADGAVGRTARLAATADAVFLHLAEAALVASVGEVRIAAAAVEVACAELTFRPAAARRLADECAAYAKGTARLRAAERAVPAANLTRDQLVVTARALTAAAHAHTGARTIAFDADALATLGVDGADVVAAFSVDAAVGAVASTGVGLAGAALAVERAALRAIGASITVLAARGGPTRECGSTHAEVRVAEAGATVGCRLAGIAELRQVATALALGSAAGRGPSRCAEARRRTRPGGSTASGRGAAAIRSTVGAVARATRAVGGVRCGAATAGSTEGHRHAERERQTCENSSCHGCFGVCGRYGGRF